MSDDVIYDYIVIKVPPGTELDQPGVLQRLSDYADDAVVGQYKGKPPRALLFREPKWIITSDWRDVERFQPAHNCAACRAGNDQAVAFLKEHPEERIALGNLSYEEVW